MQVRAQSYAPCAPWITSVALPGARYKYGYFMLDSQPPIGWLIDACAGTDASVYGYCCANPDGPAPASARSGTSLGLRID